ncbi:tetratricopeptide repeat protein [Alkalihalobacillus trypoxylicola]|uniref:Uncharacterized protein n=1 Tax=Alkalihalobacillus trypoxylicola TaxID=519424 RepID=A0A162DUN7_9BACI|nr:hypothetical protein [Alkalihalobacillus trypoxylicola]KYG30886.1 hypothetical protein AZF04_18755 [Alkalihalobacillus trypoxylicola]
MKRKESYYIKKSDKGLKLLEEGLSLYPNNEGLNRLMAKFLYESKIADKSVYYWEKTIEIQGGKPNVSDSIGLAKALNEEGSNSRAIKVLTQIVKNNPKNQEVQYILAKTYRLTEQYQKAISLWELLFSNKSFNASEADFIESADNYSNLQKYVEASNILIEGLKKNKRSSNILSKLIDVTLLSQRWEESLNYLEEYHKLKEQVDIELSMVQQLLGNHKEADLKMQKVLNDGCKLEETYKKLTIFDNGKTRVEFYKKLEKNKRVIIVFDSLNWTWNRKPFAFDLLLRQDVDIIAVRKGKKGYFQDFSFESFNKTITKLLSGYDEKFSYGYSLGAYAAIYYTSKLECKILALSPRLSIHSEFGKKNLRGKRFLHDTHFEKNERIEPIIVYDPKNKQDRKYINEGIKPFFPNACFIESPYSGHGVAPHLLKMGLLKEFVLKFLQNEIPNYDNNLRTRSSSYYRVLGDECFKRNKPRWALDLVEHATYLDPNDSSNMRLKIHILNGLGKHKEAVNFARNCKKIVESDRTIRSLLIDSLVFMNDMEGARKEIDDYIDIFGRTPGITKKEQKLKREAENLNVNKI